MRRDDVIDLITQERRRQRSLWGRNHAWGRGDCSSWQVADRARLDQTAHLLRLAVLTEEMGEVARAVLEDDTDRLRAELVQVAAVAVAWLEAL